MRLARWAGTWTCKVGYLVCLLQLVAGSPLSLGVISQPELGGLKNPSMAGALERAVGTRGAALISLALIVSVGGGLLAHALVAGRLSL